MDCVIKGHNVKSLAKAIHAMAKIGDDLYIQSSSSGLFFRTVNSSQSAYACFTFKTAFFEDYKFVTDMRCKVSLKSCLMAFKSLPALDKQVEKCQLTAESVGSTLLVQFFCKHEVTKIYHLPFIENETIQASFQKEACACELTAQTKLLSDGIQNFSSSVDEITLSATSSAVTLKNYVEEHKKMVHTEINLESQEFTSYSVEQDVDVTFCLKELKAILGFAEGCALMISCDSGGKPIIFGVDGVVGVDSQFVLSTVADRTTRLSESQESSISASHDHEGIPTDSHNKIDKSSKKPKNQNKTAYAHIVSRVSQPANATSSHHSPEQSNHQDDGDMDVDEIPLTPPSKRFRKEFLGLGSQLSQYTSMMPEDDEVLAADSDEES